MSASLPSTPASGSQTLRAVDPPKPSVLIDSDAASELLGVPATWIRAEARADRIPHVKLGRYVRFHAEELEAWWRARARGPWRDRGAAARVAQAHSKKHFGGTAGFSTGSDPVANGRGSA